MVFCILNNPCIPVMKPIWSWCVHCLYAWIQFVRILLSIFASVFIREIGVKFFLCWVFVRFWCKCNCGFIEWTGKFSLCFYFWNSLKSIGLRSSLGVWKNSALNPSGSGIFLVRSLLLTASISLEVMGLFRLFSDPDLIFIFGICL